MFILFFSAFMWEGVRIFSGFIVNIVVYDVCFINDLFTAVASSSCFKYHLKVTHDKRHFWLQNKKK